jgi:fibronectin type 3 domain-containing protein
MNRFMGWVSAALFALLGLAPFAASAQTSYTDEFNGGTLGAGWSTFDGYKIQYPGDTANHAVFGMTGTQLSVSFPGGAEHNMWWIRHAAVVRDYLGSGVYQTKVDTAFTGDQQFGLVFQSAPDTFLIFMLYATDQVRGYVERFANVDGVQHHFTYHGGSTGLTVPAAGPYHIRVTVYDDPVPTERFWRFEWSQDGNTWTKLVEGVLEGPNAYENAGTLTKVGVFAGNQPTLFSAYNAKFDYFRYSDGTVIEAPDAPSNVIAKAGNNRVDLTWSAVPTVESYAVYSASTSGGPYTLAGTTAGTTFAHTGLTNGAKKHYVVKSVRAGLESGPSIEIPVVPHALTDMATLPSSGLVLSLSASELAHVLTNGQPVSQWVNAIGPVAAGIASGSSKPTFVTSALNGKPVVRFDGVDDFLALTQGFQDFTAGASIFVVAKPTTLQSGFKLVLLGNGADQQNVGFGRAGETAGLQYFTGSSSGDVAWFDTDEGIVAGQARLFSIVQEPGSANSLSFAEAGANGTPVYGQNVYVPPVTNRTVNYIGRSYWAEGWFQGDIAEVLVYNRALNETELLLVKQYIAEKYALAIEGVPGYEPPLAAPAGLAAVAGDSTVSLSWQAVSGVSGYRVFRAVGAGSPVQIADLTTLSYTDNSVTNGTTYTYTVKAYKVSTSQVSDASGAVNATPNPPPAPNPALPSSGLILALDAGNAALQYGNGQPVAVWQDASGANYHAVAGAGAPILVTNAINGKPALRFDGVDDYLTLPAGFQDFTAGITMYVVARPSNLQTGFKLVALGNGASQQNIGLGRAWDSSGLQYWTDNSWGDTGWFNTTSGITSNQTKLFSVTQDAGAANASVYAEVAVNGIALAGGDVWSPPVTTRSTNYIGKSFWNEGMFEGDIAEVIIYNRKLSSGEQSTVRAYLGQKYGLSVP